MEKHIRQRTEWARHTEEEFTVRDLILENIQEIYLPVNVENKLNVFKQQIIGSCGET